MNVICLYLISHGMFSTGKCRIYWGWNVIKLDLSLQCHLSSLVCLAHSTDDKMSFRVLFYTLIAKVAAFLQLIYTRFANTNLLLESTEL